MNARVICDNLGISVVGDAIEDVAVTDWRDSKIEEGQWQTLAKGWRCHEPA